MTRTFLTTACLTLAIAATALAQTATPPATRNRGAGGVYVDAPVQAQHVRTMIVSCKPDETIKFYRDVLGMDVLSDDGGKPATSSQYIIDIPETGAVTRMVVFGGKGEYPAGPIIGSRIGMLGLADQTYAACKDAMAKNSRSLHGAVIMPIRVANMTEILKRVKAMGIEVIKTGPSPSKLTWQTLLYDPNGIVLELFELNVTPMEGQ